jgi:very-short-patch-repair endonuclease
MAREFLSPKEYSRQLRKNQTPAESIIWAVVRNRQLQGFKFLRQHPIKIWKTNGRCYFYFADFYCAEKRLILEIDGEIHAQLQDRDEGRDVTLGEYGYSVLHITNAEVSKNIVAVLDKILIQLTTTSLHVKREDSRSESG